MSVVAKSAIAGFATILIGVGMQFWVEARSAPYAVAYTVDTIHTAFGRPDPVYRCGQDSDVFGNRLEFTFRARDCYVFGSPRVFDGIYFDEFEGQHFLEGERSGTTYRQRGPSVWLTFDEQSQRGPIAIQTDQTQVWHVRFVGRKTVRRGMYGHFGMSCALVLVDRVISAEPLQRGSGYLSQTLVQDIGDPTDCNAASPN